MRVLILGLGVIGTSYGYLLKAAGHTVEHILRPGSPAAAVAELHVDLLDGRGHPRGLATQGSYTVEHAHPGSSYDLVLVSTGSLKLPEVLRTLQDQKCSGPILLLSGIWETRDSLNQILAGHDVALGYPVAGGELDLGNRHLDAVVFDHIELDGSERPSQARTAAIEAFTSVGITAEHPADMLEWIWVHMAINAGVISAAAVDADMTAPAQAAEALMTDTGRLRFAIRLVRECLTIVAARGVDLRRYRADVAPFRIPTMIAAPLMKRMFAGNELTRRIMLLHANPADLSYVCGSVYREGQSLGVSTPHFSAAFEQGIGLLAPESS